MTKLSDPVAPSVAMPAGGPRTPDPRTQQMPTLRDATQRVPRLTAVTLASLAATQQIERPPSARQMPCLHTMDDDARAVARNRRMWRWVTAGALLVGVATGWAVGSAIMWTAWLHVLATA